MTSPAAKPKRRLFKRVLLATALTIVAIVGILLLIYGRAAKDGWDLRERVRAAMLSGEPLVGTRPARDVLSPETLRAVFGNEPVLLAAIQRQLGKIITDNPALVETDLSVFAVAFEPDAAGNPTNLVFIFVGELKNTQVPQPKDDGTFRKHVGSEELFSLSKSMLAVAGSEVQVFGDDPAARLHREAIETVMRGDTTDFESLLKKDRRLVAIVPNPNLLLPDSVRANVRAVVLDARGSRSGTNARALVIANSPRDTRPIETLLSKWRTLASTAALAKSVSPKARHASDTINQTKIETSENTVAIRTRLDPAAMELAIRAVRATGRKIWLARAGPTPEELELLNKKDDK
jgi:hypothetical protein